jgi:hypothetical protein
VQAPAGQLLAGSSAASTLRPAASRDRVLAPRAFAHGAFRASGSGYPSTTMGYIAQLRQFFLDVAHHGELLARAARGAPGPRPPYDLELEAGLELQGAEAARPLLFEAQSAVDIARVLRCADEFGFRPGIVGGREADRLAEELRTREAPLVLTLDFGEEVEDPRPKGRREKAADEKPDEKPDETPPPADETPAAPAEPDAASGESADTAPEESADTDRWVYRAPYPVRLERRLRWEERRDCALRLDGAGVPFAFGTGDAAPDALLGRIRGLVERGLPQASALAALTAHPARWLGLSDRLGRIAPGADATLVLWQGNPFVSEEARPVWVFVDGHGHEVPAPELESKDGKERRR